MQASAEQMAELLAAPLAWADAVDSIKFEGDDTLQALKRQTLKGLLQPSHFIGSSPTHGSPAEYLAKEGNIEQINTLLPPREKVTPLSADLAHETEDPLADLEQKIKKRQEVLSGNIQTADQKITGLQAEIAALKAQIGTDKQQLEQLALLKTQIADARTARQRANEWKQQHADKLGGIPPEIALLTGHPYHTVHFEALSKGLGKLLELHGLNPNNPSVLQAKALLDAAKEMLQAGEAVQPQVMQVLGTKINESLAKAVDPSRLEALRQEFAASPPQPDITPLLQSAEATLSQTPPDQ